MSEQAADKKSPADRVGRHRPFIMAGTAASGAVSLFRVFLCNERGFMAANLLSGLASAMWISFMVFYTGKFGKEDQQRATSRIVMFNNLGILPFSSSEIREKKRGLSGRNGGRVSGSGGNRGCGDYNRESILLRKEKC